MNRARYVNLIMNFTRTTIIVLPGNARANQLPSIAMMHSQFGGAEGG